MGLSPTPPLVNNMATDNLSDEQIMWIRRKCRDHRGERADEETYDPDVAGENQYFSDSELDQFFLEESCDFAQTAAKALESWATDMDIGLGGYSAQGVTVNGQQIAQGMRTAAGLIRMENTRA